MTAQSASLHQFNRFELKYVTSLDRAARLRDELLSHLVIDTVGSPTGVYPLWSLYFDSPSLLYYWEKIDGEKFRRKLRIRHYGRAEELTDATPVMVEIKQRVNRVTQKRRTSLTYADAMALCCHGVIPEQTDADQSFLEEVASLVLRDSLRPTTVVGYHREALMGTDFDQGLRITFDRRVVGRGRDLDLRIEGENRYLISPNRTIVEVKVDERAPRWLTYTMARHNVQLERVSKYCLSVEAAGLQNRPAFDRYETHDFHAKENQ